MKSRFPLRSFSLALCALGAVTVLAGASFGQGSEVGAAAAPPAADKLAQAVRVAEATASLTLDDGTAAKCIYRCNSVVYPTLQACNDACREFADFCVITGC